MQSLHWRSRPCFILDPQSIRSASGSDSSRKLAHNVNQCTALFRDMTAHLSIVFELSSIIVRHRHLDNPSHLEDIQEITVATSGVG